MTKTRYVIKNKKGKLIDVTSDVNKWLAMHNKKKVFKEYPQDIMDAARQFKKERALAIKNLETATKRINRVEQLIGKRKKK